MIAVLPILIAAATLVPVTGRKGPVHALLATWERPGCVAKDATPFWILQSAELREMEATGRLRWMDGRARFEQALMREADKIWTARLEGLTRLEIFKRSWGSPAETPSGPITDSDAEAMMGALERAERASDPFIPSTLTARDIPARMTLVTRPEPHCNGSFIGVSRALVDGPWAFISTLDRRGGWSWALRWNGSAWQVMASRLDLIT